MALETSERIWLEVSWESLSKEALNKEMSRYMMEWDTDGIRNFRTYLIRSIMGKLI